MLNFYDNQPVYLGSASPRRKELFAYLFQKFQILSSEDELLRIQGVGSEFALENALYKSLSILKSNQLESGFLFCFDTVVALNDRLLGKFENRDEAFEVLKLLSGQSHQVHTGVSLVSVDGKHLLQKVYSTEVEFFDLPPKLIDCWLDKDKFQDKAGAYAIQDLSFCFIRKIEGCYYNVMGLPAPGLLHDLLSLGICRFL
ncbi:MAG: septum formation protein Maf [Candidatus Cloacimonetes bacterium]|nr:septum formation protein Maf [Candidatus Cloacimonadota bacterium]